MGDVKITERNAQVSLDQQDLDDLALVQLAIGDRGAFAILYQRHVNRVYRYALARLGNEQDAQDITAQTFIIAMEKITSYRGEGAFPAWLFGIAYYLVGEHYRKDKKPMDLERASDIPAGGASVDDIVIENLQLAHVIEAMSLLSKDRVEALTLRVFGGLTAREIAKLMDKSEAAVKMLVYRAVRDLRAQMVDENQE